MGLCSFTVVQIIDCATFHDRIHRRLAIFPSTHSNCSITSQSPRMRWRMQRVKKLQEKKGPSMIGRRAWPCIGTALVGTHRQFAADCCFSLDLAKLPTAAKLPPRQPRQPQMRALLSPDHLIAGCSQSALGIVRPSTGVASPNLVSRTLDHDCHAVGTSRAPLRPKKTGLDPSSCVVTRA